MKNYICGKCKREFNSKASLKKHKETVCFKREKFAFNILAAFLIFSVLFILLSVHSVHALSFPAGITNYVALNISNSQSTATPNPFQQMINVTSTDSGWTYINNTGNHFGQNVEFFYSNGTVIPSWLEQYHSGYAIWWVKTGSIAASSTLTIYMGFANKTTNLFNNKTTGEAPTLSSTYGEYDDGANVFNFYDNFAGTTLSSKWTVPANSSYTVNNGFIAEPSGGSTTAVYDANVEENSSIITEWGLNMSSTSYPNAANNFQLNRYTGNSNMHFLGVSGSDGLANNGITITTVSISSSNSQIFGVWNDGTTVTWFYEGSSYTDTSATSKTDYVSLIWSYNGQTNNAPTINWVRTRAYPPNGVMPSVTFGSVQQVVAITLYLNGLSNTNTTITYGTESNFTAVTSSSTDYVSLYVNGTKVVSLTQGKATYLKTLAAGLYKVTAVTNTSGVNNQTYYEKISTATHYLSLSSSPNINYTYNGTKLNITAKVLSDLNNQ